jgi:two-component system response regulator FlrC
MPLGLQAKLLRVLQEREVERVGGKKPVALDIRVLATSNRDMLKEVAAGRFREDLYYRLNVFPIAIPALRERPGDIVPLARHFLARHAARQQRQVRFSPAAEALLPQYAWPGNVRELENTMHRVLILTPGDEVAAETIRLCLPQWRPEAANPAGAAAGIAGLAGQPGDAGAGAGGPAPERPANMKDLEREHILATLRAFGGSRKKTVEKLGISERTLRYKLQQYRDEGHDV